jgi:hypothetical protein
MASDTPAPPAEPSNEALIGKLVNAATRFAASTYGQAKTDYSAQADAAVLDELLQAAYERETAGRAKELAAIERLTKTRAAVLARMGVPQWRDIASAPKDGTQFIAWYAKMGVRELTWWTGEKWARFGGTAQPTHWQPLPAAPEGK